MFGLQAVLFGRLAFGFHLLAAVFELFDDILKVDGIAGKGLLCPLNDLFGHAQPLGDGKRIGTARYTGDQPVGGTQRLHVKFTAGIFHPIGLQGVELQLGIVGGGHHSGASVAQPFDERYGQCRTFHRVGAGTKLVEQYQCFGIGLL